jgi:hypothetical protein
MVVFLVELPCRCALWSTTLLHKAFLCLSLLCASHLWIMLLLAVFNSFFSPDPCSQSSSRSRVTHDFGNFHLLSSRRITCFLPFYLITWLILFNPQICVKVAFSSFSYIAFLFDQSDFRFASYLRMMHWLIFTCLICCLLTVGSLESTRNLQRGEILQ